MAEKNSEAKQTHPVDLKHLSAHLKLPGQSMGQEPALEEVARLVMNKPEQLSAPDMLVLQRSLGNHAVNGLFAGASDADHLFGRDHNQEARLNSRDQRRQESGLKDETEEEITPAADSVTHHEKNVSVPISIEIPRVQKAAESARSDMEDTASFSHDSIEGAETLEVNQGEEEGQASIRMTDSITATMPHTAPITQGGITVPGTAFGLTELAPRLSGVTVTQNTGSFAVTGTINCPIKWDVHNLSRTNIADENAAAITKANYTAVAADLTPDMSSDNGRPPRQHYWCQDLTEQHEKFHAGEYATYSLAGANLAVGWLRGQTASSEAQVRTFVDEIPSRIISEINTTMTPAAESRAYGDGAPSYKARADAITKKGTEGKYT